MDGNPFFKDDEEESQTSTTDESPSKSTSDAPVSEKSSQDKESTSDDNDKDEDKDDDNDDLGPDESDEDKPKRTSDELKKIEEDILAKIKALPDWPEYLSDKDLMEDLFFEIESDLDFEDFVRIARKLKKDKAFKEWQEENE